MLADPRCSRIRGGGRCDKQPGSGCSALGFGYGNMQVGLGVGGGGAVWRHALAHSRCRNACAAVGQRMRVGNETIDQLGGCRVEPVNLGEVCIVYCHELAKGDGAMDLFEQTQDRGACCRIRGCSQ